MVLFSRRQLAEQALEHCKRSQQLTALLAVDDEEAFLRELAAAQATPLPASGRARSQRAGQPGQQSTDQVDFDPIDSDLE